MIKIIKDIFEGINGSLDTTERPFSARKLTAFAIIAAVIAAHVKWLTLGDLSELEGVLMIDYAFVAALFGLTTYQNIKNAGTKDN